MKRAWPAVLNAGTLVLGAGAVLAAPLTVALDQQPQTFIREHPWAIVAPIAAYTLAVLWAWTSTKSPLRAIWNATLVFTVVLGLSALAVLVIDVPWPRRPLVAAAAVGAVMALIIGILRQPYRAITAVASAGTLAVLGGYMFTRGGESAAVEDRTLQTRYAALLLRTYQHSLPDGPTTGGGFATAAGRLFLITGDGQLAELTFDANDRMNVRHLPLTAPINGEFARRAAARKQVNAFRAAGMFVVERESRLRFFVLHHFWHEDQQCFTMRVSTIERPANAVDQKVAGEWSTLYETRPCLPLPTRFSQTAFGIQESGGRFLPFDDDHLLVTVGDHGFDGVSESPPQAQNPESDYGKMLLIHTGTGERQIYSLGHRNQQGLHRDRDGVLWSSEQGPDGGDEINRVERGANYGWPVETYGTDYGLKIWPNNPHPGEHRDFTSPLFTWVPAIGLTSVIRVRGTDFTNWEDDFIAGTLRDNSLHRLRMRDGRVVFDERIPLNRRLRDVAQVAPDRLVVVTDDRAIISIRPQKVGSAETEAYAPCATCHPVVDGRSHGIGPDLAGIYRRLVASAPAYDFSPGMKAVSFRWNYEQLNRFIENPSAVVPGTTMNFEGIADPVQRDRIITYLQQGR